jgi:hypothetical protein
MKTGMPTIIFCYLSASLLVSYVASISKRSREIGIKDIIYILNNKDGLGVIVGI